MYFKSHLSIRSCANNSDQRGELRADQHQEDLRELRLPEPGPGHHPVSDGPTEGRLHHSQISRGNSGALPVCSYQPQTQLSTKCIFQQLLLYLNIFCSKVPVCSSEDLDCVESVEINSKECIERCDGIIVDAINQNKPKDNSKIEQLLIEYENYKFPNKSDVPFPFSLNGKIVFVQSFYYL